MELAELQASAICPSLRADCLPVFKCAVRGAIHFDGSRKRRPGFSKVEASVWLYQAQLYTGRKALCPRFRPFRGRSPLSKEVRIEARAARSSDASSSRNVFALRR